MRDTEHGIYTIKYPGYYEGPTSPPSPDQRKPGVRTPSERPTTPVEALPASRRRMSRMGGLLFDVLLTAAVAVFLVISQYGMIPSTTGGFYCNDPSIAHKFTGDTISVITLLVITYFVPLLVLWIVEAGNASHNEYTTSLKSRTLKGARSMWRWYKEYLVGVTAVLVLTEIAKLIVGGPRPHFLDTCQPDMASTCTAGGYVETFTCTSQTASVRSIKDSSKSFPSGHTSISVFTCIFMSWFIKRRVSPNIASFFVPWLQCLCVVWAMCCSLTRIVDHRHHWWDVLAGTVLGVVIAVYTVSTHCNKFKLASSKIETQSINGICLSKDNTQAVNNGNRHQSVRRLLSSTSSYAGSISQEEKELREMPT